MFEFELDNSSYFDFSTKEKMDFVIKQNSELPILEIRPIITSNFKDLIKNIKDAYVTFSMYDSDMCPKILNKAVLINLDTKLNKYNEKDDTCEDMGDFTLQYFFTKKETSKIGFFTGEFKIVFNTEPQKTLIVPINNKLNIIITP